MFTQAALHPCPFVLEVTVYLLNVISQVTIFNYTKFQQCTQGDNGPLNIFP